MFQSAKLPTILSTVLLALLMQVFIPTCWAQTFSYDGNRWYEIEVSIFTNDGLGTSDEWVIPEHVTLGYPTPIMQLVPAVQSFMVPFDSDNIESDLSAAQELSAIPAIEGPEEFVESGDFKLTDFSRDPFIALGSDHAKFNDYNQDIQRSGEHRLLFHALWRQPVLNRVQATALFVSGGEQFGEHYELEGSLRFSYNINRVDMETHLWLSKFAQTQAPVDSRWHLPPLPIESGISSPLLEYPVLNLSYMNQTRAMISNDLHYLDHPAMGVLVEIRPYQLPELTGFSFD